MKYKYGDILEDLSNLNDINYSHVIHAAADSTNVTNLSYIARYEQIVEGTRNVLEFVKDKLPESKFLFISSGGVYGNMPSDKVSFKESDSSPSEIIKSENLNSSNVYSISKRAAENLCSSYYDKYDLNISIARCFCFSGIHLPLNVHFAIGNFVQNVIDDKDIIIKIENRKEKLKTCQGMSSYFPAQNLCQKRVFIILLETIFLDTFWVILEPFGTPSSSRIPVFFSTLGMFNS